MGPACAPPRSGSSRSHAARLQRPLLRGSREEAAAPGLAPDWGQNNFPRRKLLCAAVAGGRAVPAGPGSPAAGETPLGNPAPAPPARPRATSHGPRRGPGSWRCRVVLNRFLCKSRGRTGSGVNAELGPLPDPWLYPPSGKGRPPGLHPRDTAGHAPGAALIAPGGGERGVNLSPLGCRDGDGAGLLCNSCENESQGAWGSAAGRGGKPGATSDTRV